MSQGIDRNSRLAATIGPVLATKLQVPLSSGELVRPRLIDRLRAGRSGKLTVVSAPAGFGQTAVVSAWVAGLREQGTRVAWLSLDAGDSDLARFLTYLVAALRSVQPDLGEGMLAALRSPEEPPATEALLSALINEIAAVSEEFVLVLDETTISGSTRRQSMTPWRRCLNVCRHRWT